MAGERRKPVQNGLHRTSSLVLAMPFDPRSARRGGPAAAVDCRGHACRRPRVPRAWPQQCRLEQHGTRTYSLLLLDCRRRRIGGGRWARHACVCTLRLPSHMPCRLPCVGGEEGPSVPVPATHVAGAAVVTLLGPIDRSSPAGRPAVSVCGLLLAALLWRTTTCRRRKWPPSQPQAHASSAAMMNGWPRRLVNAWPALPPGWRWTTATD